MMMASRALHAIIISPHGRALFATHTLGMFGAYSGAFQLWDQLFPQPAAVQFAVNALALLACAIWGLFKSYPHQSISHQFSRPDFRIVIAVGDLFDQEADVIIGFSDTFDTAVDGANVISRRSVQAQLIGRLYDGDTGALDDALTHALREVEPVRVESPEHKLHGKLIRYPVGTVATLTRDRRRIYALAYSRMRNDLVAVSTLDDLWLSLSQLWDSIFRFGERKVTAMPIVGSGLSRIDVLDRASLLKLLLLSYVSRSRQRVICDELRLVVQPEDAERVDLLEIADFLKSL